MFAEAAVGCSSGTHFLCGRSLERLKHLGKPRLSRLRPLPSKTGGRVPRCSPPANQIRGAVGRMLPSSLPGGSSEPAGTSSVLGVQGKAWGLAAHLVQLSDELKTFWKLLLPTLFPMPCLSCLFSAFVPVWLCFNPDFALPVLCLHGPFSSPLHPSRLSPTRPLSFCLAP